MSRRVLDDEDDGEVLLASFSNLIPSVKKRGRKRVRGNTEIPNPRPVQPAPIVDNRNYQRPTYTGDATNEEIDNNLMNLPEVRLGGKSQNDFLREWLPRRSDQLNTLLELEGPRNPSGRCERCGEGGGEWRCKQCVGGKMVCGGCLRDQHASLPYHQVERWTGKYFAVGALWQVGVKIYLGHKGNRCPTINPPPEGSSQPAEGCFEESAGDPDVPEAEQAGDGDEDDVWVFVEDETSLRSGPRAPSTDGQGNYFISIVDVTGVHYLPVVHCSCSTGADHNVEYLKMGLFPASFSRVRTAFTTDVLRDYRLSNLECKTSAYQYYQRIRRLTSPAFPRTVVNRYRELRRLSRQYRNLILWKIHGKAFENLQISPSEGLQGPQGESDDWDMEIPRASSLPAGGPGAPHGGPPEGQHGGGTPPPAGHRLDTRGTLAIFCAACPQPGVNLAPNWKDDPNQFLYTRSLVADGNFKADHLNQKNEADDVHLTNGEAFMTAEEPYQDHIKEATRLYPRYKQKPTCNNHHANSDADKAALGKRVRGVGAHACARHGCFCPSSVVDFSKGEKQMHMDWSLVQAMETTNMKQMLRLMHLYDVNCQFAIHLKRRLLESTKMSWPDTLKIISAIGLFHVHGHKDECLYRFASTYIPGVGVIDGEILETLWAILNETSRSTRGATTAHRREVLDDHMGDSNWKKNINMPVTIGKKYLRAVQQEKESREYFEDVEASTPADVRERWKAEVVAAELSREDDFKAMDMMQSRNKRLPTKKEMEVQLGERELRNKAISGSAEWIGSGLELETSQYVPSAGRIHRPLRSTRGRRRDGVTNWFSRFELRALIRRYGDVPTPNQRLEVIKKQRTMKRDIEEYIHKSARFLGVKAMADISKDEKAVLDDDVDDDEVPDLGNERITIADPERQPLPFPSGTSDGFRRGLPADDMARLEGLLTVEITMRKGNANDCLEAIRNDLIQLSWQFKYQIRHNKSQKTKTKSWAGVNLLKRHWKLHRLIYNRDRFAMGAAGGEEMVNKDYPYLRKEDCVASAALADPNTPGQSSRRMTWLWRGVRFDDDLLSNDYAIEFWRVNWMTARAQHNRWVEELQLTKKEMEWTVGFYLHMRQKWLGRRDLLPPEAAGHHAYAEKQMQMWKELGRTANEYFVDLGCGFTPITSLTSR